MPLPKNKVFTATPTTKGGKAVDDTDETIALVCYHYPQYTIKEAEQLPYKRVAQLLRVAIREQAKEHIELVRIISAPHIKGGNAVKQLLHSYQKIIDKLK